MAIEGILHRRFATEKADMVINIARTGDVYVPGCPPTADALLYGTVQLQNKIRRMNTIAR